MDMDLYARFETLWNRYDDFVLPEVQPNWCRYAQKFAEWADKLCQVTEDPDVVSVNQAKVLLVDKYFDWVNAVPRRHRQPRVYRGHICLYQVFMRTYERLKQAELTITPPLLFIPPPPPPPRPIPEGPMLFLGEIDE